MSSVLDFTTALAKPKIVRFGMVGVANTTLDFVLFNSLVYGLGLAVPISNILSYGCGIINSFLLNRSFTFGDCVDGGMRRQALMFLVVNLLGLTFSTLLVTWLSGFMPEAAAKALSVPVLFVWNFLGSRYLVFTSPSKLPA